MKRELLTAICAACVFFSVSSLSAEDFELISESIQDESLEYGDDSYASDGCCDSCCCQSCCCQSCWTAGIDYLYMWRERTGSDFVLAENLFVPLLRASDLAFDEGSGVSVNIRHDLGCNRALELRYMTFGPSDERRVIETGVHRPATNPTTLAVIGNGLDTSYQTETHSFELLLHKCRCGNPFTVGFRYIDLNESFTFRRLTPVPPVDTFRFEANNRLYGFQLGTERCLWDNGCLRIDGVAKAGLYLNDSTATAGILFPGTERRTDSDKNLASIVSELGVTATYDIRCNLALRVGYQLLLLDGVVLASDQIPNTGDLIVANPTSRIDKNTLIYHGLNFGLEFRF